MREAAVEEVETRGSRGGVVRNRLTSLFLENAVWVLLAGVFIAAGTMNTFFISVGNIQNILVQATVLGYVGLAVAFSLLVGEIDLSIVGVLVFSGVVGALLMEGGVVGGGAAIALMIGCGALIGLINGVCVSYLRMVSLIETLAMGLVLGGAVLAITKSQTISVDDPVFLLIGHEELGGWPLMPLALVGVYVLAWFVLNRLPVGRRIYAVGGNSRAAAAAGIRNARVKLLAFVISGALCGAAGVLQTSYLSGINSTVGSTILLYAVAAPVIGGVSLRGGQGRVIGMLGGVLLITVIQVALQIVNISAYYVQMAGGAVIFVGVLLDSLRVRQRG